MSKRSISEENERMMTAKHEESSSVTDQQPHDGTVIDRLWNRVSSWLDTSSETSR